MVKKPCVVRGVHDRQLAALQRIAAVRIDLAHHLDERIVAGDEQALLAVGREAHVVAVEGVGAGDRDRLLAGAFHVEAGLALALGAVHAVVEDADQHHVAEDPAQGVGIELRVPGADRLPLLVEHPDQRIDQLVGVGGRGIGVGAADAARGGDLDMAEIDRVPRPRRRLRNVEGEGRPVGTLGFPGHPHPCSLRLRGP